MGARKTPLLNALTRLRRLADKLFRIEPNPLDKEQHDCRDILSDADEVDGAFPFKPSCSGDRAGTTCIFDNAGDECAVGKSITIKAHGLVLKGPAVVIHSDLLLGSTGRMTEGARVHNPGARGR